MIACVDSNCETDAEHIARLEGDISVLQLQVSARICSECPAGETLKTVAAAAGYRDGEHFTAAALIARLRDGDR